MAWAMETDYLKYTHFQWRLEHLEARGIMCDAASLIPCEPFVVPKEKSLGSVQRHPSLYMSSPAASNTKSKPLVYRKCLKFLANTKL